jgi:hypothetical protein
MSTTRQGNKLVRFWRLERADKWLLLRAAGWLAVARIMLVVMPFRRLSERLSAANDTTGKIPDEEMTARIGYFVAVAANHVPWRSDCFPQTIAARMLLKRYGFDSTIHLGVDRIAKDEIEAHAWLTCGETVVTGQGDLDRYAEIYRLGA